MDKTESVEDRMKRFKEEDKRFIQSPGGWTRWPSLPMKRSQAKGGGCGFLMDTQPLGIPVDREHESLRSVYLANPWEYFGDMTREQRKAVKIQVYETVDAMLEDGWMVD